MTISEFIQVYKSTPIKRDRYVENIKLIGCKSCGATSKTLRKVKDHYLCTDCYNKHKEVVKYEGVCN